MADLFTPDITPEIRAAVIAELRAKATELAPAGRNAFPGICGVMSGTDIDGRQPFGLYTEEKTLERTVAAFRRMLDVAEGVELYRPCNGGEGRDFMARWCERCVHDAACQTDPNALGCEIIADTMALDVDDDDYPREWRQGGPEGPRCTAFEALKVDRP